MKTKIPKMICWMKKSNSHGLVLYDAQWLPEGVKVESENSSDYVHISKFDLEEQEVEDIRIEGWDN